MCTALKNTGTSISLESSEMNLLYLLWSPPAEPITGYSIHLKILLLHPDFTLFQIHVTKYHKIFIEQVQPAFSKLPLHDLKSGDIVIWKDVKENCPGV